MRSTELLLNPKAGEKHVVQIADYAGILGGLLQRLYQGDFNQVEGGMLATNIIANNRTE